MDAETAQRWAWSYLDLYRVDAKRRHLGLKGPSKSLSTEALRYLAHRERTAAARTYNNNSAALSTQFVPFIGADVAVDVVDRDLVQRFVDGLLHRGYAIGTVITYLAIVRAFFRWRSKGEHDPTRGVELPNPGERDVEPWTDDELTVLRTAADELDAAPALVDVGRPTTLRSYRLALELAIATGCRIGELAALDWSAIDAAERTVRVRWQVPQSGDVSALQPLKGRKNRTTLILPSWWDYHDAKGRGRILVAKPGETISHRAISRWYSDIITAAKLKRPGKNAHTARHTYARLVLDLGGRLEELQRFLGHTSIRTTEQFYGWMTGESATMLARSRIYGESIRLVKSAAAPAAVAR